MLDISDDISHEDFIYLFPDLELCWSYFANYDCYLLNSEDASLNKNDFSNFYNINFSFKK